MSSDTGSVAHRPPFDVLIHGGVENAQRPRTWWRQDPLEPDLPVDYAAILTVLKHLVGNAQHRAKRTANTAMIELYWNIGRTIANRQSSQPWGSKVLERLARDLRNEFPHMKGFSRTDLYNMRASPRWQIVDLTDSQR